MSKYRQVGGRLGAYIRANNPATQQIQALLADLLAEDELLPTMREVVSRDSFQRLQGLAGSGGGTIQRDVLLKELSRRYLPIVIEEVNELLNGMLDLKQTPSSFRTEHREETTESKDQEPCDPWTSNKSVPPNSDSDRETKTAPKADPSTQRQLTPSEICDENLWNTQRDPESDKRFLKAWNLRWFNKRYRPRLERD